MAKLVTFNLMPVYVRGSHDDFMAAVRSKLDDLAADGPEDGTVKLSSVSHAVAFGPDGEMYWSALLSGEVSAD